MTGVISSGSISRFLFLSQIGTVAVSRDLDLRKRVSRFKFCAVAARKNCSRTCLILRKRTLRSPDLILKLRKESFYFPALALCYRESRNGRPLSCPLSCRFVDMDRDLPIVSGSALRFVRALPTPFSRRPIDMVSVARVHAFLGYPE